MLKHAGVASLSNLPSPPQRPIQGKFIVPPIALGGMLIVSPDTGGMYGRSIYDEQPSYLPPFELETMRGRHTDYPHARHVNGDV